MPELQKSQSGKAMASRSGSHRFYVVAVLIGLLSFAMAAMPAHAQGTSASVAQQDWIEASRHMQAGDPAGALPYLERLVRDHPDVVVYRLELGYALYLLGRDGRAKYHFEQARGANLSGLQRRAVDNALANIAKRKTWSVRLGFSLEPASNAGRGTAASSVALGDLVFSIPDNLRTRPATGALISAGLTYRPRITEKLSASFNLDTVVKHYDDRALRETLLISRTGLRFEPRPNTFFEGGVLLGRTYAAGDPYSIRKGLYANYYRPIGDRASVRFDIENYRVTHDTHFRADGTRSQVSSQFSYALGPNALLRARGYILWTDAMSPLQSGRQGALSLGGTYAFKGGLVASMDVTMGRDERDGINGLTGMRRLDTSRAIEAELFTSKYQIGRFLPVLRMKLETNRSNEVLNSYTNRSLGIGFRTAF